MKAGEGNDIENEMFVDYILHLYSERSSCDTITWTNLEIHFNKGSIAKPYVTISLVKVVPISSHVNIL